ncbi:MAG: hypothetical protein J1E82_08185 [Muribaculaceae bacterium]|nr:hypothetical protein [Muribaculaceae bacterium]
MKKLIFAILSIAILLPTASMDAKSKLEKAREKALKERTKELKKGGWEPVGTKTLELCLEEHFAKLNDLGEDGHEVVGISNKSKSKNVGVQTALNNAVITYAQEAGSTLKGRVISDINSNGVDPAGEFENFYAAYERLVEKEIKGELRPSFTILKTNKDGTVEVRTFFIVEEGQARLARQRALENAMKESELAAKHADQLSDFVRRGFEE